MNVIFLFTLALSIARGVLSVINLVRLVCSLRVQDANKIYLEGFLMDERNQNQTGTTSALASIIKTSLSNMIGALLKKKDRVIIRKAADIISKSDEHDLYFVSLLTREEADKLVADIKTVKSVGGAL